MGAKRKVSLSLDADLVAELEQVTDEGLSGQVNEAVRTEVDRRRRQQSLRALLERFDRDEGPLGPSDEAEISRYERALGGR